MLASPCYSVRLNFNLSSHLDRRYVLLELELESFKIPLDIKIEVLFSFIIGIFVTDLSHIYGMRHEDIFFAAQYAGRKFEHYITDDTSEMSRLQAPLC